MESKPHVNLIFEGSLGSPKPPKAIILCTVADESSIKGVDGEDAILLELPHFNIWGGDRCFVWRRVRRLLRLLERFGYGNSSKLCSPNHSFIHKTSLSIHRYRCVHCNPKKGGKFSGKYVATHPMISII